MHTPIKLTYRDYVGKVDYDPADEVYYGEVIGIGDSIAFEAPTVQLLQKSFESEINDYLAFCKGVGKTPEITDPEIRRQALLPGAVTLQDLTCRKSSV